MFEKPTWVQIRLAHLLPGMQYRFIIKAMNDLHASVVMSQDSDLTVLPDGVANHLNFKNYSRYETKYFSYLPPSNKFQLALNAYSNPTGVNYSISIVKFSSAYEDSNRMLNDLIEFHGASKAAPVEAHMDRRYWLRY